MLELKKTVYGLKEAGKGWYDKVVDIIDFWGIKSNWNQFFFFFGKR